MLINCRLASQLDFSGIIVTISNRFPDRARYIVYTGYCCWEKRKHINIVLILHTYTYMRLRIDRCSADTSYPGISLSSYRTDDSRINFNYIIKQWNLNFLLVWSFIIHYAWPNSDSILSFLNRIASVAFYVVALDAHNHCLINRFHTIFANSWLENDLTICCETQLLYSFFCFYLFFSNEMNA